jgi:DNA-binding MarR family transcriptional regulator
MPENNTNGIQLLRMALKCHKIEIDLANLTALSVNEFHCLLQLYLEEPCCVGKLTEILGIGATSTSKLLRSLDRKGLVTRNPDPIDRRRETVALTEPGIQKVMRGLTIAEAISDRILQQIPEERIECFTRCLGLLSVDYEPLRLIHQSSNP